MELLRKAVQAHRAYTDRVSEPCSCSLSCLFVLSIFLSIPAKNCLFPKHLEIYFKLMPFDPGSGGARL